MYIPRSYILKLALTNKKRYDCGGLYPIIKKNNLSWSLNNQDFLNDKDESLELNSKLTITVEQAENYECLMGEKWPGLIAKEL